jgi:5'(3')-deoxyribonucleotidase
MEKIEEKTNEIDLKITPLTLEEFIQQKIPSEYKDRLDEIKDHYIIYLVTNKDSHHYSTYKYMNRWITNEFYLLSKTQY